MVLVRRPGGVIGRIGGRSISNPDVADPYSKTPVPSQSTSSSSSSSTSGSTVVTGSSGSSSSITSILDNILADLESEISYLLSFLP